MILESEIASNAGDLEKDSPNLPEPPEMHESRYSGPVMITEHLVGGQILRLVRPEAPDRLLDSPQVIDWNRRDDYMPYWAYLWPGALLLAEAVMREPLSELASLNSDNSQVLEIGCGLGMAGLMALRRNCRVVFSDYDEAPFPFIRRSIDENGLDGRLAEMRRLDWRELPDEKYPLILGSDVIYERRLVPLVVDLLAKMLMPEGTGLISSPLRVAAEAFPAAVEERGLVCKLDPLVGRDERGEETRGTLYRVTRPSS